MKKIIPYIKKYLRPALLVFFAAIFLISAGVLADYFINSNKQKGQFDELSNLVDKIQQEMNASQGDGSSSTGSLSKYVEVTDPETGKKFMALREYAEIYKMNSDMAGWIKIDGTNINYPVMHTPDQANYYLKRDFYKNSSRHGSIYAAESASLTMPSDNITLYGHKMADGTMFASLHKYQDKSFFEAHPLIQFDTLTEHHTYQISYVFIISAAPDTDFAYHIFVDGSEKEFNDFIANCKSRALYDTGSEIVYGDKLITLSTCEHNVANGRLVVVARRIG